MRILDIGAGIDWVNPKNPDEDLAKKKGGLQEAQIRWLHWNTLSKVRKVLRIEETLFVDGLDLQKPEDFIKEGLVFRGMTADEIDDTQYDALTWFSPNPWQVAYFSNLEKQTHQNPLDVVVAAIQRNLKTDGLLILETEMPPTEKSLEQDPHRTHVVLKLIRDHLEKVVVPTDIVFKTNDPWREFSCVYQKKDAA